MTCLLLTCLATCLPVPHYPSLEGEKTTQDYHGTSVADPYRFLEEAKNEKTLKWIHEENALSTKYLQSIPVRAKLHQRINELTLYDKYSVPIKAGKRLLFFSQSGLQAQPILYVQDGLHKELRILIDPNLLSKEGEVSLGEMAPSFDGKYLAYTLSQKGSDWKEIQIIEMKSGKRLKDSLIKVKFPSIAWKGKGFYYSAYSSQDQAVDTSQKIYYHKIGSLQTKDKLIYSNDKDLYEMYAPRTTEDGELLLFVSAKGKVGTEVLWYTKGKWTPIVDNFDHINEFIDLFDSKCYLLQDN